MERADPGGKGGGAPAPPGADPTISAQASPKYATTGMRKWTMISDYGRPGPPLLHEPSTPSPRRARVHRPGDGRAPAWRGPRGGAEGRPERRLHGLPRGGAPRPEGEG